MLRSRTLCCNIICGARLMTELYRESTAHRARSLELRFDINHQCLVLHVCKCQLLAAEIKSLIVAVGIDMMYRVDRLGADRACHEGVEGSC